MTYPKLIALSLPVALMAGVQGCAVGPDYKPPVTQSPPAWRQGDPAAITRDAPVVSAWWTTFADPTLDSLVRRAVDSNHDLRIASARVREARAQRGVVASDYGPRTDASGRATRDRQSTNTRQGSRFGEPESSTFQAGFDMTWELDFWGRIRRSVEAADASIGSALADRDAVMVTLLAEVGRNYIELRGLQQRTLVTEKNIAVQQAALDLTRKRFDAGLTTELDVQQAATQLATTQAALPPLQSASVRAAHRLAVLIGAQPQILLDELAAPADIPQVPAHVPVGLPSDLLLRRPDIARAERDLAAATARIGVATAEFFPRFSLTGSLGLQSGRASDFAESDSRFWSIGPGFNWPVLDWGRIRSNVRVQDARTEQALLAYERTVLTSFEEVENALADLDAERRRGEALARSVQAAQRAVELAQQQYTSGLRDFLNVLTTQRSLFESEDQLTASRQRLATSLVALYKALGGGWDTDWSAPTSATEPEIPAR